MLRFIYVVVMSCHFSVLSTIICFGFNLKPGAQLLLPLPKHIPMLSLLGYNWRVISLQHVLRHFSQHSFSLKSEKQKNDKVATLQANGQSFRLLLWQQTRKQRSLATKNNMSPTKKDKGQERTLLPGLYGDLTQYCENEK